MAERIPAVAAMMAAHFHDRDLDQRGEFTSGSPGPPPPPAPEPFRPPRPDWEAELAERARIERQEREAAERERTAAVEEELRRIRAVDEQTAPAKRTWQREQLRGN